MDFLVSCHLKSLFNSADDTRTEQVTKSSMAEQVKSYIDMITPFDTSHFPFEKIQRFILFIHVDVNCLSHLFIEYIDNYMDDMDLMYCTNDICPNTNNSKLLPK